MFQNRSVVIATQHKKESVIGPHIEEALGVKWFAPHNMNTDELGSFCGSVERVLHPIEAARKKCEIAMQLTGCDLAIGSEGSFGPHPDLFFIPSDEEYLVLVDKKNNLEIIARELSSDTNFHATTLSQLSELDPFIEKVKFPSHAVNIRISKSDFSSFWNGISNGEELQHLAHTLLAKHGTLYIETDMRAMNNPTRMRVIERACLQLIEKTKSLCPSCNAPGFSVYQSIQGLPCSQCAYPTKSTLKLIYSCQICLFKIEEKYPRGIEKESPQFCDICNP